MNRTLVLSDLHLGRVTTYAHAPEVIAPLVDGFERVLLLGDIIDHWYTHPQQVQHLEHRILEICKASGVKEVIYFRGNHDACNEDGEEFALMDGILYLHGHAVYHRLRGTGSAADRIRALNDRKFGSHRTASRMDKHIWTLVDRMYGSIPMAILNPIAWPWPVMRRIKALANEVSAGATVQAVVLGHSHRPGVRHFQNMTLFNLGGWLKNTRACAFIREGHRVKLLRIENRSHRLRWGDTIHESELLSP